MTGQRQARAHEMKDCEHAQVLDVLLVWLVHPPPLTSIRLEVALCLAMNLVASSIAIGLGATVLVDLWALARHRMWGIPLPDWGLVGRWMAWLPRGRFRHQPIAATPAVRGERVIGWTAHYGIGAAFALALVAVQGAEWLARPTVMPALLFGMATVAAPFLVMQPGMGAGIAASRSPRPGVSRLHSLLTHGMFGLGLYVTARLINAVLG
jgi:hypothetical protein